MIARILLHPYTADLLMLAGLVLLLVIPTCNPALPRVTP